MTQASGDDPTPNDELDPGQFVGRPPTGDARQGEFMSEDQSPPQSDRAEKTDQPDEPDEPDEHSEDEQ
jgi:hypothetical protein